MSVCPTLRVGRRAPCAPPTACACSAPAKDSPEALECDEPGRQVEGFDGPPCATQSLVRSQQERLGIVIPYAFAVRSMIRPCRFPPSGREATSDGSSKLEWATR